MFLLWCLLMVYFNDVKRVMGKRVNVVLVDGKVVVNVLVEKYVFSLKKNHVVISYNGLNEEIPLSKIESFKVLKNVQL